MAEAILFQFSADIITKLASAAFREVGLLWGVNDELDQLQDTLSSIQAVLHDAEEKQFDSETVKDWVSKLKEVLYEIDDLIDESSYETLRRQIMAKDRSKRKQVRMLFSKFKSNLKMGLKIREIRQRLKVINDDKTQFSFPEHVLIADTRKDESRKRPETHSFILDEEVIGRNDDKETIIDLLLNSNTKENVAIISVVGMGGLGKTALAQYVYNHNMVAKHFELKLWVCISDEFNVKVIIKNIIESATGEKFKSSLQMDSLQSKLRSELDRKKYLLVMDDVWNDKHGEWVSLKRFLMDGAAYGSRILITTRSEKVAKTFNTTVLHSLEILDESNSWLLFKKMTLLEEEQLENSNLVEIGKEIVAKLKGNPLAIRVVGRLLHDKKTKRFWESFKDKELYQVMKPKDLEDILSILKLSYKYLPVNLKQCFLYCALFPKDYEIQKDELILQWRAQGFIQPNDRDNGEDCFMELLSRSFFQEVTTNQFGDIKTCKMHDLMHDLACSITGNECVLHGVKNEINKRTYHFSFDSASFDELQEVSKTLSSARNLRTFSQLNRIWYVEKVELENILNDHLQLRTLNLKSIQLIYSPVCKFNFGKLKHLRYLSILKLDFKELPKCIFELYNLETLILIRWDELEKVPSGIKRLINLKHLDLSENVKLEFLPNSITELNNLETLLLSKCAELKELPRDVKNWINLRHLNLSENGSIEFLPDSITELNNLETLLLSKCAKLKELPRDVKNWINLKHLDLSKNESIEFLPNSITELNNLETLLLSECAELKELPRDVKNWINLKHLDLSKNKSIEFLPDSITELNNLETLLLSGCAKLKELPSDVKNWINLKHLVLSNNKSIEFLPNSITELNKLETLLLFACEKLKELPRDTKKLISLKHLDLDFCGNLSHMPKGLGELTNLEILNEFVLGKDNNNNNGGGLSELNGLNKLRGSLNIKNLQWCSAADLPMMAANKFLQQKSGLEVLELEWGDLSDEPTNEGGMKDVDERVLDCLQPHSNLRKITIEGYKGVKLCNWVSPNFLGCLVKIRLVGCKRLKHLPSLDQFPNLKDLFLEHLPNIEYMFGNKEEDFVCSSTSSFPSLEWLWIVGMPKLKGWWKLGTTTLMRSMEGSFTINFPCLSELKIEDSPLHILMSSHAPLLKLLEIDYSDNNPIEEVEFDVVPWNNFENLSHLSLSGLSKLEYLPESLQHVKNLKNLCLRDCHNLKRLPEWIQNLTSLTWLEISGCEKLSLLPAGIRHISSLQSLNIYNCPILEEKCKKDTGEDWPKIAHIRYLKIHDDEFFNRPF